MTSLVHDSRPLQSGLVWYVVLAEPVHISTESLGSSAKAVSDRVRKSVVNRYFIVLQKISCRGADRVAQKDTAGRCPKVGNGHSGAILTSDGRMSASDDVCWWCVFRSCIRLCAVCRLVMTADDRMEQSFSRETQIVLYGLPPP